MGQNMSSQVQNQIQEVFSDWSIVNKNITLQAVTTKEVYVEGNDYDCGVFTVYLLAALALNKALPDNICLTESQSKQLGQNLRKQLNDNNDNIDFDTIHDHVQIFCQQHAGLKGTAEYGTNLTIELIDPYFLEYTLDGIADILDLRMKDLKLDGIKALRGIFIDQERNNINELLDHAIDKGSKTTLVPLDLFNRHAAGLIFERTTEDVVQIKYFDPENKPVPTDLKQILSGHMISIEQLTVEQQKYSNCGPEVIEDFVLYLTGERLTQEEAVPFHSHLVECHLLHGTVYENHQEMKISGHDTHHQ